MLTQYLTVLRESFAKLKWNGECLLFREGTGQVFMDQLTEFLKTLDPDVYVPENLSKLKSHLVNNFVKRHSRVRHYVSGTISFLPAV